MQNNLICILKRKSMAGETITMTKLKQIFLLRNNGISLDAISKNVQSSRNTVKKYIRLAGLKGLSFDLLSTKEDHELEKIFADPVQVSKDRFQHLEELFPWIEKELKRTGVTRWTLWGEYKSRYPDGYSYSHFCEYYKQWSESQSAVMHFEHEPADKMYIDFTGKKLSITDEDTGEIQELEVFVALLGFSQYTYVEALRSQKKEDFIQAIQNALHFFGGVPHALVPDNLKSAVTKADKYEPDLNETFLDFANHYQTTVLPARSRKPRDKALVENAVSLVYSRIFAPLRNESFFSIDQLNFVIREQLDKHNNQCFQREPVSRKDKFIKQERSLLMPLPKERYEIKQYKTAKVMKNCHVQLEKHYYSVPYRYIGKTVKIIYTTKHVHIFQGTDRIATHERGLKPFSYTTQGEHLPSTHQFISQWSPEKFLQWSEKISPTVKAYIEQILGQKNYPEQSYRSCAGILSFEKKVGRERLIKAIERATNYHAYNYKVIKNIIEGKLDMLAEQQTGARQQNLPFHENIRGKENYK
jgi:transposase